MVPPNHPFVHRGFSMNFSPCILGGQIFPIFGNQHPNSWPTPSTWEVGKVSGVDFLKAKDKDATQQKRGLKSHFMEIQGYPPKATPPKK